MKQIFRKFLKMSAFFTSESLEKRMARDGTLGLSDYVSLTVNGVALIFSALVFGIIFGPFMLLFTGFVSMMKKINGAINRVRVKVD